MTILVRRWDVRTWLMRFLKLTHGLCYNWVFLLREAFLILQIIRVIARKAPCNQQRFNRFKCFHRIEYEEVK